MKGIIIAGLGWSGSSALVDYLFDKNFVVGYMSDYPEETRILNYKSTEELYEIIQSIKELELQKAEIFNHFTNKSFVYSNYNGKRKISRHNNIRTHKHYKVKETYKKLKEYSDDYNSINIDTDKVIQIISKKLIKIITNKLDFIRIYNEILFEIITYRSESKSKIVLFNNDFRFWDRKSIANLNDFKKIIVYRNPLDQIGDSLYTKHEYPIFKRQIILAKFMLFYPYVTIKISLMKIFFKKAIHIISFESFLKDIKIKKYVDSLVGCKTETFISNRFDNEASLKNIYSPRSKLSKFHLVLLTLLSMPFWIMLRLLDNR